MNQGFPKERHVRKRREFLAASRNGRRVRTQNLIILTNRNGLDFPRLGITANKKVGKAVFRNRIKRLIREYFRLNNNRFRVGYDFIVLVKPGHTIRQLADLEVEFETFFAGSNKAKA